jgi:hypothetical protein
MVKPQNKITLTQSYTSMHQKSLKMRLLQFLNNIYRENRIPDEWRNAVITTIFKKGDRREA